MKKVTILALNNALSSSIMGTMDIFCQAGLTWNTIMGVETVPYFEVEIVTQDGKPVQGFNQAVIQPNRAMTDVESTDLIIISSFADFDTLSSNRGVLTWIKDQYGQGATIASICVGAFILAETGLLDGKTATTHWGFIRKFQRRYPQIELRPDQLITDEGDLLCSGACNSYIDLSVYLIERYCGREVAVNSSKTMIHDFARTSQSPYRSLNQVHDEEDAQIYSIIEDIKENYKISTDFNLLARDHGMSRRTFERRFKTATGITPLHFLQRTRVEAAKQMLETGKTFDEITYNVGYHDSSSFRKVFIRLTGLRPKEYQEKFRR